MCNRAIDISIFEMLMIPIELRTQIHEIKLNMRSSSKISLSKEITAHNQSASLTSISVSDSTITR